MHVMPAFVNAAFFFRHAFHVVPLCILEKKTFLF